MACLPPRSLRCENCRTAGGWAEEPERAELLRCLACGGRTWSGASPDADGLYDAGYFNGGEYVAYDAAAAAHRRNFQRKLRLLGRHLSLPFGRVRLLELGCATGAFLAEARDAGIRDVLGVEPSAWARERAARRGFTVLAPSDGGLVGAIAALRPNLIVAWDVWEHLPRPAATLEDVLSAADARAAIAISTVDAGSLVARIRGTRWRQFHPPTHLQYPTRRSLRIWLEARGFAVRHHRSFGYHRPLVEYWRAVGGRPPGPAAAARLPWCLPLLLDLWDIQLVIAERTK